MRLHASVSGPDDGPAVVFLHGASGSLATWAWLPAEIIEGRRVVRVDLRGHGASSRAPGTYDVDHYAGDVLETLLSVVGRPAVLVGHSLGAVVAWTVAQRHPELVLAAFLEDPPLYMGEPAEHELNRAVPIFSTILETVAGWHADGVSAEAAAAQLAAAPWGPDPSRTAGEAMADDAPLSRAQALLAMDPGVLEGAVDRSTLADTDTESPVDVPVVLLAAEDALSAFPVRHEERLASSHPDVTVVRVPGAPHAIHDDRAARPAYVSALSSFLAAHAE